MTCRVLLSLARGPQLKATPPGHKPKCVWLNACSPLCLTAPDSSCLNHPHLDGLITHFWLAVEKLVLLGHPTGDVDEPVSLDLPTLPWVVSLVFLLSHLIQAQLSSLITQRGLPSLTLQSMEYPSRGAWGWSLCSSKAPSAHSLPFGKVTLLCFSNFFPFLFSLQPGLWASQIWSQIIKHVFNAVRQFSNWHLSLSSGLWILLFTKVDKMVVFIVAINCCLCNWTLTNSKECRKELEKSS